jgi:hypothetical protein
VLSPGAGVDETGVGSSGDVETTPNQRTANDRFGATAGE